MGPSEVGWFDLANPGFMQVEATLIEGLPGLARLALWALVGSAVSMGLYRLLSPQAKIREAGKQAGRLRRQLAAYEDDFAGLLPLAAAVLSASLRHFFYILAPAISASVPLLFLLSWISSAYGGKLPPPGTEIAVSIAPETAEAKWSSPAAVEALSPHAWRVVWPTEKAAFSLREGDGTMVLRLPLPHPVGAVHKRLWWNHLFANPNGYVPTDSTIELVSIDLPAQTFIDFGPGWARTWELPFFSLLVLFSLAIKFTFRIR